MSVSLIVNPSAGGGKAGQRIPQVVASLRSTFSDHSIAVLRAESYEHARTLIAAAAAAAGSATTADDTDIVVVMGGDGMMHLGINAVAGSSVPLGMIPAGSGNDLCRGLGYPIKDLDAVLALLQQPPRPIDAIRMGPVAGQDIWIASILISGFDARVNLRANAMSFPRGRAQYPMAIVAELVRFKPIHYDLMIDGQRRELEAMLVAVGNTTTYGGGIAMCPNADPDDGWLDLTIIHPVPRWKLVQMFVEIFSGSFTRLAQVEQLRAREVRIDGHLATGEKLTMMGDGEVIGVAPRLATLVPGAVSVFRP